MNKNRLLSRIGNWEMSSKLPLVELSGHCRVLIENHLGVIAYSPNEIEVKVSYGFVRIAGNSMMLAEMCREQLVITGQIDQILVRRR